jgi:uncharacterized protein (DUF433 family)
MQQHGPDSLLNWRDRIDCSPDVLVGKPRIKGTRISVAFVLECLRGGSSFDDLLSNYPHLTRDDIEAAIDCAAETQHQNAKFAARCLARRLVIAYGASTAPKAGRRTNRRWWSRASHEARVD